MGQDDEDDALMLQSKQQITFNVVNKRKDQLRQWQNSEMNAEPARRTKRPKVQFQDSDIFLSACMSGDEEEVDELLAKGADINTCTLDGLTALHQSVIDSKPEMVRFLCEKGADVNAQDNEGWTPLHAAACCGNVAIVKYLCQHGADLSIVNSDKELALDLAVEEPCREVLDDIYRRQKIDVDACRDMELNLMMKDAKHWLTTGDYRDIPHPRTGGTALHVAAARGYTTLLETLIKAGGNVRAQDKDGWTPLHAAAHWAERDACKILVDSGADVGDTTFAGQDVLTVADKDVVDYLIELGEHAARTSREKRNGSATPVTVLQDKNHRDDHVLLSTERKRDLQHRDQHSENEFLHATSPSPPSTTATIVDIAAPTTTITLTLNQPTQRESSQESVGEEEEPDAEEEEEAEEEAEAEAEEELEEEEASVSRNSESVSSNRTSSERETSPPSSSPATTSSSRFASTTPSSQRSISLPPVVAAQVGDATTPRSSIESVGDVVVVVATPPPVVPTTAPPPKAVHQSPSSWINRGFPLSSRAASSSSTTTSSASLITRSMSTPASDVVATSSSQQHVATPPTKLKSSSSATPSPAGSVTISATFTKPSRWQSKTVNESEAERRNNSRMQRQHRRSTQGVTKEQLEEASRFASDEVSRRNSATILPTTINNNTVRLASEEKDLSPESGGDVSTTAVLSLAANPVATSVRRKSQGLTLSRSNRRATGPVNPEDLAQLSSSSSPTATTPPATTTTAATSLRLATAPYSPASIRSVSGTVPTMTSRFSEKAHSLPPATNGNGLNAPSISSRSAIVAGLSPAPTSRTSNSTTLATSSSLMNSSSSRYAPSSSLSSNTSSSVVNPTSSYTLHSRPTETNLNYKALYEKERAECERLRRENDDLKRASSQSTMDNWRGGVTSSAASWRTRQSSPSTQNQVNLSVAKSTSLASFDENERRSMERKITDLELQLKTTQNLRLENQRLKEENGALVRVISKMTI